MTDILLTAEERELASVIGFDEAALVIVKDETDGILCGYGGGRYGHPFDPRQGTFQALVTVLPDASPNFAMVALRLNARLSKLGYEAFCWIGVDTKPYLGVICQVDPSTDARRRREMIQEKLLLPKIQCGFGGPGDWDMYLAFDNLTPDVARLPHLVFEGRAENLKAVLDVSGDKAAWLGRSIFDCFDVCPDLAAELNARYPNFDDLDDFCDSWEAFGLWSRSEVQAYLLDYAYRINCSNSSACFTSATLSKAPVINWDLAPYEYVPTMIDHLNWAMFPLWWESMDVIFVAAPEHADWIDEVIARVKGEGRWVKQMQWGRKRYYLQVV